MAKENLSELSTEDLLKKKKVATAATGALAGLLTILLVLAIYLVIEQGSAFISLVAVAFALLPVLFLNYAMIGNINKELKSRGVEL